MVMTPAIWLTIYSLAVSIVLGICFLLGYVAMRNNKDSEAGFVSVFLGMWCLVSVVFCGGRLVYLLTGGE